MSGWNNRLIEIAIENEKDASFRAGRKLWLKFCQTIDEMDNDCTIIKHRVSYKAKFKKILRKAKKDTQLKNQIGEEIERLRCRETMSKKIPDIEYFDESVRIFQQHYIDGWSIARIMTSTKFAMCESEIHRKLDYICDLILSDGGRYFDYYYPGIFDKLKK